MLEAEKLYSAHSLQAGRGPQQSLITSIELWIVIDHQASVSGPKTSVIGGS
jgi:hypothetical protein